LSGFEGSIPLPDEIALKMELADLPPLIRRIIQPTIEAAVDRFKRTKSTSGWMDMKFDPVNGEERDASLEYYRKDRVYGWIQGRGLESLTGHLRWLETLPGYRTLEGKELLEVAESLYSKLMKTCFPPSGIKAYFVMDLSGSPIGHHCEGRETTLSHLFVLRGLLAFAMHRGYSEDLSRIADALRVAVDASIRGECVNDQIKFDDSGELAFSIDRKGYEGQMISIGACELLFASSKAEEDKSRGVEIIRSVLSKYVFKTELPGLFLIDAFDREGLPARQNGHLTTNPGHALEFVGLALQYLRHTAATATQFDLSDKEVPGADKDSMIDTLFSLASRYTRIARAPHGGIVLSMDAETGAVLNGNCPWWSSFETARTFAEMYLASGDEAGKRYCAAQIKSYIRCIEEVYLKPSLIGIPVQAVSISGDVARVIPATPDIDAGYHTGMPLIDVYDIVGKSSAMLCGSAETPIPAHLGLRLQGHVARVAPAEKEMDPLHVRCSWLASAHTQVLFISADVLEFSVEWSDALYAAIESRYGVPRGNIFLLATHTHTAPCATDLGMLKSDKAFLDSLERTMLATIGAASRAMAPTVGTLGASIVKGIGINRRYRDATTGKISMRPNFNGENDDSLICLFLLDVNGKVRNIFLNFAVHPTTLGISTHEISADYPGRAVARIKENFGIDVIVIPVQGACGDIRPMVLDENRTEFAEGQESDIDRIGSAISEGVSLAFAEMAGNARHWIDGTSLSTCTRSVDLAFASLPAYEDLRHLSAQLEDDIERMKTMPDQAQGFAGKHENALLTAQTFREWARVLLKTAFSDDHVFIGPIHASARFSLCSLDDSLLFFSLPGEAFCHIGKSLKQRAKPAAMIVCGYSGGSVGYIPTEEAFAEGGYEVEEAFKFYGLPAPLSPETEGKIYEVFDSMRKEINSCQH